MALEINDAFNKFLTNTNNIDKFKKKKPLPWQRLTIRLTLHFGTNEMRETCNTSTPFNLGFVDRCLNGRFELALGQ
jgi:hypothetical protein